EELTGTQPDELPKSGTTRCVVHGQSDAAFVCKHLAARVTAPGASIGFVQPSPRDKNSRQAWCRECDAMFLREGQWNDVSEAFAKVTMICADCFDSLAESQKI
ncbi:MAG TPA: hypothetical protein VHP33_14920, partial [Polyangiaceae bacterium]|nr:hypothetical protein [Polyangiaceae bacterium]